MTIAVQPPAYFPGLAYTALIHHVDHFILADTFRFRRQSFQNRSKLRNAQGGHWITIPLFGRPEGAPLHTVDIETGGRWQEKHWRSFLYDYRSTMYFDFFQEPLQAFYDHTWTSLADCTVRSVTLQADLYGLDTPLHRATDLEGAPATPSAIVDTLGADVLLALPGDEVSPTDAPTMRRFHHDPPSYHQNFGGFEPGTTGMDLFFNYGPEAPSYLAQGVEVEPLASEAADEGEAPS